MGLEFDNPSPIEGETASFHYKLDACVLSVKPRVIFPSRAEARLVVDPFLRAWELDFALDHGRRDLQFVVRRPAAYSFSAGSNFKGRRNTSEMP